MFYLEHADFFYLATPCAAPSILSPPWTIKTQLCENINKYVHLMMPHTTVEKRIYIINLNFKNAHPKNRFYGVNFGALNIFVG
jgi:hypothetical protein